MPVRSDAADDPFFSSDLFSGFIEALDYCNSTPVFSAYPAFLDTIGEAYSNILSGSASLDEAYETMVQKANDVIAEAAE